VTGPSACPGARLLLAAGVALAAAVAGLVLLRHRETGGRTDLVQE
jgi:hypothetical protein